MSFDDNIPAWFTRELLAEIKQRNTLSAKASKTKLEIDKIIAKRKRNYITGLKKNLKKNYYRNALNQAKSDPKKLWRILRLIVGGKKSKNRISNLNGKMDNMDMANELNKFFVEVGSKLADEIPHAVIEQNYEFDHIRPIFEFQMTTIEEVKELLNKIPNNKSTGLDGIPIKFMKLVPDLMSRVLCHIINLSLSLRKVPIKWKKGCITPLFKDGN